MYDTNKFYGATHTHNLSGRHEQLSRMKAKSEQEEKGTKRTDKDRMDWLEMQNVAINAMISGYETGCDDVGGKSYRQTVRAMVDKHMNDEVRKHD